MISIYVLFFQHGPGGNFFVEEDPDTIIVEVEGRGNLNVEEKFSFLQEIQNVSNDCSWVLKQSVCNKLEKMTLEIEATQIDWEQSYIEMPFDKDVHIQSGSDVLRELQGKLKILQV